MLECEPGNLGGCGDVAIYTDLEGMKGSKRLLQEFWNAKLHLSSRGGKR